MLLAAGVQRTPILRSCVALVRGALVRLLHVTRVWTVIRRPGTNPVWVICRRAYDRATFPVNAQTRGLRPLAE